METDKDPINDDSYRELLCREYDYLTKMYISNEDLGEKRVNIFLSLASAALAIFGVISGIEFPLVEMIRLGSMLFTVVTVVLLLFGWITLKRIITRNIDTTEYVNRIDSIRRAYVKRHEEEKILHLAFNPYKEPKIRSIDPGLRSLLSFGRGGLMENVVLMNSIIFIGFVISLLGWASVVLEGFIQVLVYGILAVTAFIGIWIFQMDHVRKKYDAKIPEKAAGGIVWREADNTKEVALVQRERHEEKKLTLPKGKLKEEKGKTEAWKKAAKREGGEELGIDIRDLRIGDFADKNVYTITKENPLTELKEEKIKAVYFWIIEAKSNYPATKRDKEVKDVTWLPIDQARDIVEDENKNRLKEMFEYPAEAEIFEKVIKNQFSAKTKEKTEEQK